LKCKKKSDTASKDFEKITLEKRLTIEKPFTTEPKTRRTKRGNRSIRRTVEELVDSWYPETQVNYEAMRLRLITRFERCSRQTVLAYLGRPKTIQVEHIEQNVRYLKSGTQTLKEHTFKHRLPAKKGYLELFGLATLQSDPRTRRVWFRLHHQKQTRLIPPETPLPEITEEVSRYGVTKDKNFLSVDSVPEPTVERHANGVFEENIAEKERRERLLSERKKRRDEHIRKKICPELTEEESRILQVASTKEARP